MKTRVVKKNVNPEWDEDLTLSVEDTSLPVKLVSILGSANTNPEFNWSGSCYSKVHKCYDRSPYV